MIRALFLFISFGLCSAPAIFGWNETGHRAIALLAYEQLTPEARAGVSRILAAHPHASTLLPENVSRGALDEAALVFANAAKWPDDVRKPPHAVNFHHPTWHWVNLSYVPSEYAKEIDAAKLGEAGDVLTQIPRNLAILGDASAPLAERAIALCWVEHLIGDIHQPLHAVALFAPELPKGDQGGNLLGVRTSEKAKSVTNLHSIWDSTLGRGSGFKGAQNAASRIRAEHPDPDRRSDAKEHLTARSWAEESYRVAVVHAYLDGALRFRVTKWGEKPDPTTVPALPPDYQINARGVASERAALAAHRLARAINAALSAARPIE